MKSTAIASQKELKNLHLDNLDWKSNLEFIESEVKFINQLLNSYVFEPTTPNLFERLQEYKITMKTLEKDISKLHQEIRKHENELGGMLECDTISCDNYYYKDHLILQQDFDEFYQRFKKLKSEVFNYAGGILKKNKKDC
ncbi:hypothetical protein D1816_18790 [Aquimarina sp. AD10]|uniref:hypothetical protein n=1 Tax=Aquimarina sp. AD10 TaxID=1714849 RepID=UPI000E4DE27B|nr:hypothetical protein [Aquimarina sp. AD10]AXT62322.1 hypothetical protein D1816_18790 [Aquimarina sp. AD10]RKM90482.1 hypothetical protein D7033_23590 [Aquimarina sp. AD10]